MSRKSSRTISGGLIVISLLVWALFWQPMRDDVIVLSDELTTKQAELQVLDNQLASLVSVEASLPVADSERERLLASVPVGLTQDQIVDDLNSIAKRGGVDLNSITFSMQGTQPSGAKTLAISANFAGEYDDLVGLLQALESNERIFKVTSIGVQLGELNEDGSAFTMTFSVSLEAYYQ